FHDRQTVFHFLSKLLGDIFRESIWFLRLLVKLFFRYFSKNNAVATLFFIHNADFYNNETSETLFLFILSLSSLSAIAFLISSRERKE
ncbi:MAG: hypothetical protein LBB61_06100, partial [Treponema sp.]|nr:hypothetical protein [Treponema sp.]